MIFFTKISKRKSPVHQSPFYFISIVLTLILTSSVNVYASGKTVPGTPGPISGQINVCAYAGTGQAVSYTINPVAGAELYLWIVPPSAHIVSGQGTTSITVTFTAAITSDANKQIRVKAISQEGNSAERILYLASQQPSTPASIVGPTNACVYIGTSGQATYTTARDAAATGYIWGSDPARTLVTHPNGPGVNDTIIRVIFKSGYKTSPITVQALNNCGFSAARILSVSGTAPSTPGVITGPTNGCAYMLPNGATATYSINAVAGASSYTWITPANCVVNHPNGPGSMDVSITVQYPADFVSGSITVIASSGCDDSSPRSLAVTKLNPGTPSPITAVQKALCPDRQYSYTLTSMPSNAVAVNWTVPAEALSFTGQGGASIIVSYPENHVNGLITATGVNNCASSSTRQTVVTLSRCQLERGNGSSANTNLPAVGAVKQNKEEILPEIMQVNISPNPSKGDFKLQVLTRDRAIINIKLLDLQGREVKKMNMVQGQSLLFGSELRSGTYILEVSQGKVKHTEKLLKL